MLEQYKLSEIKYCDQLNENYHIPLNKAFYINVQIRDKSKFFCAIHSRPVKGMMSPYDWFFTLMNYGELADYSEEAVQSRITELKNWWNTI